MTIGASVRIGMSNKEHRDFVARYFQWEHLPEVLRAISMPFCSLAELMLEMPFNDEAELMAGLRKLLEAKDCAVRAAL